MSIDGSGGNLAMDYDEHHRTYGGFVRGAKYLAGLVALILVAMAILLL
ncbi:MAG: aa3-type cytochrome c oxidase subunit IV [Hyphomicrobiaceae bacterium]|nr:aa3-type cytochrome c oxidase subunit IV [Hyphomicrobiaceae bacterium]